MKPETLKALEGSIVKWTKIVNRETADRGPDNCPLCKRFDPFSDNPCVIGEEGEEEQCPVMIATGESNCNGSPYEEFDDLMGSNYYWTSRGLRRIRVKDDETVMLAQLELEFLKDLLPPDERRSA